MKLFSEINKDNTRKECQLRRYLALTYSSLQRELDKKDKSIWRWYRWIFENQKDISFAISFNYDLLLETTLKQGNIHYFRTGSNEDQHGLPILKPHGSIDFDIQQPQYKNVLSQLFIAPQIWSITTSLNQVNDVVQSIPSSHLLLPRLEADIIPPSQENYQLHLEWVKEGFKLYNNLSNEITDFIMIGHSYSLCDRKEIDHFLERLKPGSLIHIVNPQISDGLIGKLESLSLRYRIIVDFETMPW